MAHNYGNEDHQVSEIAMHHSLCQLSKSSPSPNRSFVGKPTLFYKLLAVMSDIGFFLLSLPMFVPLGAPVDPVAASELDGCQSRAVI